MEAKLKTLEIVNETAEKMFTQWGINKTIV